MFSSSRSRSMCSNEAAFSGLACSTFALALAAPFAASPPPETRQVDEAVFAFYQSVMLHMKA